MTSLCLIPRVGEDPSPPQFDVFIERYEHAGYYLFRLGIDLLVRPGDENLFEHQVREIQLGHGCELSYRRGEPFVLSAEGEDEPGLIAILEFLEYISPALTTVFGRRTSEIRTILQDILVVALDDEAEEQTFRIRFQDAVDYYDVYFAVCELIAQDSGQDFRPAELLVNWRLHWLTAALPMRLGLHGAISSELISSCSENLEALRRVRLPAGAYSPVSPIVHNTPESS